MTQTAFFRLLKSPIDDKGDVLAAQIAALNVTGQADETYTLDLADSLLRSLVLLHIKRYSKSRRKALIYWLLQSEKRNYAVWLYIHRLRYDSLYAVGRNYADAKIKLEQVRLEELRAGLATLEDSARHRHEREIERQQRIVDEVSAFGKTLDQVALLNLPPDLNNGVTIGIAPLWELVPWKEAQRTWEKLVAGEYAWSTMARRMREKGIVK